LQIVGQTGAEELEALVLFDAVDADDRVLQVRRGRIWNPCYDFFDFFRQKIG
jgi:hypothetical protein